jgi:hypothetical protein
VGVFTGAAVSAGAGATGPVGGGAKALGLTGTAVGGVGPVGGAAVGAAVGGVVAAVAGGFVAGCVVAAVVCDGGSTFFVWGMP